MSAELYGCPQLNQRNVVVQGFVVEFGVRNQLSATVSLFLENNVHYANLNVVNFKLPLLSQRSPKLQYVPT